MTRANRLAALRIVRILALVVWVGGVIFFAFVVAPVAFGSLPSRHEAGIVVGASLRVLHTLGLGAGAVYLLASLFGHAGVSRHPGQRARASAAGAVLVVSMVGTTAASQWVVLPKMEEDRVLAGGAMEEADTQSAPRVDFERLHKISEAMEGTVLLLGLVAVVLLGMEPSPRVAE